MILDERFRENAKRIMTDKHLSQSEIARRMHVSASMVNQYLSGHRSPGLEMVERFAQAMELDRATDLLEEKSLAMA